MPKYPTAHIHNRCAPPLEKNKNNESLNTKRYGSPNQIKIEIIENPIPKDNDVLIKVYTTTVNRTDCANLTAKYSRKNRKNTDGL